MRGPEQPRAAKKDDRIQSAPMHESEDAYDAENDRQRIHGGNSTPVYSFKPARGWHGGHPVCQTEAHEADSRRNSRFIFHDNDLSKALVDVLMAITFLK